MRIPFTKTHGAKNDFLLTWENEAPPANRAHVARAICDRHTGIGADGWIVIRAGNADCDAAIRLYNSDGSDSEISGNGTRCAAAFLLNAVLPQGSPAEVRILTGAGLKRLRLMERDGLRFRFEMNMGTPAVADGDLRYPLPLSTGGQTVTILNVGNPQCVVFTDGFDLDWRSMGAEIEHHPRFPNRTNVSFVRPVDEHAIEVRFWERGAGETLSSGTGSTGAAAAAVLCELVHAPVEVRTEAGPLHLRWDRDIYLTGPAEIVAGGEFYVADNAV